MGKEMESGKKLNRDEQLLHEPFTSNSDVNVYAKQFGRKEIRILNFVANDILRSIGMNKIWNSYTPEYFERVFVEQGLIPIGYYYSTFDVDTDELVFLSQENYITKRITQIRWKINKWFIKRGW